MPVHKINQINSLPAPTYGCCTVSIHYLSGLNAGIKVDPIFCGIPCAGGC